MSAARDPTSRLRAGLNPLLTTSLGGFHHHHQLNTPLSAVSMTSHNGFNAQTPVSAIQPYNPQEWIASPAPGSERGSGHFPQEPQPSPPPPPPYSPPRSQRPMSNLAFESPAANVSVARAPLPANTQRPSPEPPASFAPPPGSGGRGASRDRRFGLPSFGRRRDSDQVTTPPDTRPSPPQAHPPPNILSRPHPGPLSIQIPQQRPENEFAPNVPPGSRRAASTGAIATPVSARSRSASQVRWESGMPVPPPPPGPPPPSSRSQSQTRPNSGSVPISSQPTRRPPPSGVTALGPVPPTPADWVDREQDPIRGRSQTREPEEEEAPSVSSSSAHTDSIASGAGSPGVLNRNGALRGEKTLRERRNESRTRGIQNSIDGNLETSDLADITIPSTGGLSRRLTINRSTPRSARFNQETPRSGDVPDSHQDSRNTTPRPLGSAHAASSQPTTPSGPFSPRPMKAQNLTDTPVHIAPKALPTPPPTNRSASSSQTRLTLDTVMPTPLSPTRLVSRETVVKQTDEQFCLGTVERFQLFARHEAAAASDAERVKLFAEFIVSESRIRRERYSSAIGAMGSEIFDLTRDLFRPMPDRRESSQSQISAGEFTPQSSEPSRSHRGSMNSVYRDSGPASGGSGSAPPSAGVSPSPTATQGPNWQQSNYMPSLSPILSMSVSDNHDENDSRGRPASRWWENDSNGAPSVGLERSKRESKYMGVPKEAREALQWIDTPESMGSSSQRNSNDYPTEKMGWHEEQVATPHARGGAPSVSQPNTPNPRHLDVSRLVTLPPPYPRHHPALNNNHPELTSMRASVRSISEFAEVEATKAKFKEDSLAMRNTAKEEAAQRQQALRMNLQQEIAAGTIGYADAAAIEADANATEKTRAKEVEKAVFDRFQTDVITPLNQLLTTRINTASQLFDELRGRLFVETRQPNPNMPQEEGDEQPELLEKLTLLKWIFEAREMLHKANYDLLSERNNQYREMVLTPYRQSGNAEKLANAEAFFDEDAEKRALAFSNEVLQRTQEFCDVVDENVARGVEVQLSAFWDIAPALNALLDDVPADLRGFHIQIPAAEYGETPSYEEHPMQYLFSLVLHAEKSTYQFIESQTNLLCLLHEVKEARTAARARAMECEGQSPRRVDDMRVEEGKRLTDDLKEKVRVVQDQWGSALGETVGSVKERLGEWLLETGGWDESLEELGVFR